MVTRRWSLFLERHRCHAGPGGRPMALMRCCGNIVQQYVMYSFQDWRASDDGHKTPVGNLKVLLVAKQMSGEGAYWKICIAYIDVSKNVILIPDKYYRKVIDILWLLSLSTLRIFIWTVLLFWLPVCLTLSAAKGELIWALLRFVQLGC